MGTLTYGQELISVKVDNEKLMDYIEKKETQIEKLSEMNRHVMRLNTKLRKQKSYMLEEIDSLQYYKKYYDHSKHVIGPRVIRKIEAMVKKDE